MQIASGLYRVGSPTVNSYLIVDGHEVTIIDDRASRILDVAATRACRDR